MNFVFLFIILSVATIYSINAYPNYKQLHTVSTDTNARDSIDKLRKTAINKYSRYKDLALTSNATTSNYKMSSDVSTSNNEIFSHVSTSESQTIPIIDDNPDKAYYVKIIIGNQEFKVMLDTGSSSLWIPNKDCTSDACKGHNRFDSSSSPTFKDEGNPWDIQYGLGNASGITGIDSIQIGNITADNQIFGLANSESDDFGYDDFDGILGLGFDNLNDLDNGSSTLISTLIKQNKINPIFGCHFQHASGVDDGTFTLGGVDESKFIGEITFNSVINTVGFWEINLDGVKLDDTPMSISGRSAIIDTGSTVLFVPSDDAAAINKQIPGAEFDNKTNTYKVPCPPDPCCTSTSSIPTISLRFGGVDYTIPSEDVIYNSLFQCITVIVPFDLEGHPNTWVVGQSFLKNVYSVFDVENRKVGFAHSK
ncbi:3239_t:CDS:1 [Racocetra persica]|uniref:3239_t:CDS:1 n=1 Tax=Racocetra persica TaxID=160502 RepID=A0ACA9L5N4_9GLOM|nr:3239_t:CDS:1 [Racocetra persica]